MGKMTGSQTDRAGQEGVWRDPTGARKIENFGVLSNVGKMTGSQTEAGWKRARAGTTRHWRIWAAALGAGSNDFGTGTIFVMRVGAARTLLGARRNNPQYVKDAFTAHCPCIPPAFDCTRILADAR